MIVQPLFGGNMSMLLPPGGQDVSTMRQVPDNQEVFVHNTSDQSLTVELLSYVVEPDDQALRTHFDELGSANDAVGPDNCRLISVEPLMINRLAMSECTSGLYALGEQHIAKFNECARNVVNIHVGLLRLPVFETDIIVTLNDPLHISAQSSSHDEANNEDVGPPRWTVEQFQASILSLRLIDPSFLGGV